jgi:hypothetical protein
MVFIEQGYLHVEIRREQLFHWTLLAREANSATKRRK